MISLDDPRWESLNGGYRAPYDASIALRRLEAGEDVWDELWQELHHQGDVDDASYAGVPHLVRIARSFRGRDLNFYALVSSIEVERHRRSNPPVPAWLADSYAAALSELVELGCQDLRVVQDRDTLRSILGAIALAKADLHLGALISRSDDSEILEILEQRECWSELYG